MTELLLIIGGLFTLAFIAIWLIGWAIQGNEKDEYND
jgi:hypothetical protein